MSGSRDREGPPRRERFASWTVSQPVSGYRFSIDSVLLADFAAQGCGPTVLDLGTGAGILLLLLARLVPGLRAGTGVEIQPQLWECADRNFRENGLSDRLAAVRGDYREPVPGIAPGSFSLVISNPPYRRLGEGRRNPDRGREIARHEVTGTLGDLFRAASRYLEPGGTLALAALPGRLPEILSLSEREGIRAAGIRLVHPLRNRPANLLLYSGSRNAGPGSPVLPPLVVYEGKGRYGEEVRAIYRRLGEDRDG